MDAPSKTLLALEAIRCLYEYTLGSLFSVPLQYISPKGDGHPVLVIPGLGTTDSSTQYVRDFVDALGYNAHEWGLGRNMGPRRGIDALVDTMSERLIDISDKAGGQPVSIIGWSLGGIYGREIAKNVPDRVRQVITLGTPFKSAAESTNAGRLYELLSNDTSHKNPEIIKQIGTAPPVPFTSLYSKTDGVVHWESSIENITPLSENIEIPGASHLGLGYNPISMYIIANRLSQPIDNWLPYKG